MLERELRELSVDWPDTPDIAGSLVLAPPARRRWTLARPAWQIAIAVAALVIAVVMAVPPPRAPVLDGPGPPRPRVEHRQPAVARVGPGPPLGPPGRLR